jgi:thiamine-phosphate pyrophosphorylase
MPLPDNPSVTLISPANPDAKTFLQNLQNVLKAPPCACLILQSDNETLIAQVADMLLPTPIALVVQSSSEKTYHDQTLDGLHFDFDAKTVKPLVQKAHNQGRMAGIGQIMTRHDAMIAGENGADYLFFGLLDREEEAYAHPKTISLAQWWSTVMQTPCIALAGHSLNSLEPLKQAPIESIGVRSMIWNHPEGPQKAMNTLYEALL